jgi:hypothetical protein
MEAKRENRLVTERRVMFRKKILICLLSLVCLACLGGCDILAQQFTDVPASVVSELAYDVNPRSDYTVYIEEDGAYAPYLVLTDDYGGNVLLLREHLLEKTMPYKQNDKVGWSRGDYAAYYPDSSIDDYLNTGFYDALGKSVQNAIVNSEIVITDKASWGSGDRISRTISRKVFLLSLFELTGYKSYVSVSEGKELKYFADDYKRRNVTLPDDDHCPYWTRTPEIWETYNVIAIGSEGIIGTGGADAENGVRPAFCLKKTTEVVQRTDIVDGQTVYTIK